VSNQGRGIASTLAERWRGATRRGQSIRKGLHRGLNSLTIPLLLRGGAVWQLVGLITRRSQVQILPPLPQRICSADAVDEKAISATRSFFSLGWVPGCGRPRRDPAAERHRPDAGGPAGSAGRAACVTIAPARCNGYHQRLGGFPEFIASMDVKGLATGFQERRPVFRAPDPPEDWARSIMHRA
jgi:hypothetical protein